MEIDLTDQVAVILGRDGLLVASIKAALSHAGAIVTLRDPAEIESSAIVAELRAVNRLDILVVVSPTLGEKLRPDDSDLAAVCSLESYIQAASNALGEAEGRIIALGSVLGLLPSRRNPRSGLADTALFTLVREGAMRFGPRNVRINGLALGAIEATADSRLLAGDEGFLSHAGVKRLGTVEDVTNAVQFLADPVNTYMTGHILTVDGGWSVGFARDF